MTSELFIIGAPRSGTNMLRDLICQFPGMCTWPCDEINYIWRYGNRSANHDELSAADVTSENESYIIEQFEKLRAYSECTTIVEKTCANSLRVDFVNAIFPQARFIFIVRNGLDAIPSMLLKSKKTPNILYLWNKAMYVPTSDFVFYLTRWCRDKLFSRDIGLLGPRFVGMHVMTKSGSEALEIYTEQWRQCVLQAARDLAKLHASRVYFLRYEDLVSHPNEALIGIARFMEVDLSRVNFEALSRTVSNTSVGKGTHSLNSEQANLVVSRIGDILENYNYDYRPLSGR